MEEKISKRNDLKRFLIERDGLRCAITGEEVDSPSQLDIHHINSIKSGGADDLSNMVLVKKDINRLFSDNFILSILIMPI